MQVDPVYCVKEYFHDYPRRDRVKIKNCGFTLEETTKLLSGEKIAKASRGGTCRVYYVPIMYDNIVV